MQNASRLMKLDSVKGTRRFSVGVHGFRAFVYWVLPRVGGVKSTRAECIVWEVKLFLFSSTKLRLLSRNTLHKELSVRSVCANIRSITTVLVVSLLRTEHSALSTMYSLYWTIKSIHIID